MKWTLVKTREKKSHHRARTKKKQSQIFNLPSRNNLGCCYDFLFVCLFRSPTAFLPCKLIIYRSIRIVCCCCCCYCSNAAAEKSERFFCRVLIFRWARFIIYIIWHSYIATGTIFLLLSLSLRLVLPIRWFEFNFNSLTFVNDKWMNEWMNSLNGCNVSPQIFEKTAQEETNKKNLFRLPIIFITTQ